jgi:Spy/CpxP family protein refolding chaperone
VKAWKVILATLVIFCAGLVVGGLVEKRIAAAATPPPVSNSRAGQTRLTTLLRRMDRELALTSEQHAQIEKIISACQEKTRELYKPVALEMNSQTASACQQIRELLTPDQQVKFDALSKTRSQRGEHGDRGDRGDHDGDRGKHHDPGDFDLGGATNPSPHGD